MKLCFYNENIGTFLNVCPNLDYPLLLCYKKYWAAFFIKMFQKSYILRYQFIKLDKNAKTMMPIFSGCRTKLEFFTAWHVKQRKNDDHVINAVAFKMALF